MTAKPSMEELYNSTLVSGPIWFTSELPKYKEQILYGKVPVGAIIEIAGAKQPTGNDSRGYEFSRIADEMCQRPLMYMDSQSLFGMACGISYQFKKLLDEEAEKQKQLELKKLAEEERKIQQLADEQKIREELARKNEYIAKMLDARITQNERAVKCEAMSRLHMSYCTCCWKPKCWLQLIGVQIHQLPYFCSCRDTVCVSPDKKREVVGAGPLFEAAVIAQMGIIGETNKNQRTEVEALRRANIIIGTQRRIEAEAQRRVAVIKRQEAVALEEAKIQQRVNELMRK